MELIVIGLPTGTVTIIRNNVDEMHDWFQTAFSDDEIVVWRRFELKGRS